MVASAGCARTFGSDSLYLGPLSGSGGATRLVVAFRSRDLAFRVFLKY